MRVFELTAEQIRQAYKITSLANTIRINHASLTSDVVVESALDPHDIIYYDRRGQVHVLFDSDQTAIIETVTTTDGNVQQYRYLDAQHYASMLRGERSVDRQVIR